MRRCFKLFRRMKKTKNEINVRKYKECKKALQKIGVAVLLDIYKWHHWGDQLENECQPKQKRFWKLYIKSLRKYVIGSTIRQPKTVQCIKGHGDIISGQYKSVCTKEDQESLVPDPWQDSEPQPRMETFYIVNKKGYRNYCALVTHKWVQDLTLSQPNCSRNAPKKSYLSLRPSSTNPYRQAQHQTSGSNQTYERSSRMDNIKI